MVVIRLSRGGSSKNAFYHVMVADRRKSRDGRFIECVGYYNPEARGQDIRLKLEPERIQYWVNKGAKPTERVQYLMTELQRFPEKSQQAALRKGEAKRLQAEQALKAHKKSQVESQVESKKEEVAAVTPEITAEEAPKEASTEKPSEE